MCFKLACRKKIKIKFQLITKYLNAILAAPWNQIVNVHFFLLGCKRYSTGYIIYVFRLSKVMTGLLMISRWSIFQLTIGFRNVIVCSLFN